MIDVDAYFAHIGGNMPRPEIHCILCQRTSEREEDIGRPCDAPLPDGSLCCGIMTGQARRHPYSES